MKNTQLFLEVHIVRLKCPTLLPANQHVLGTEIMKIWTWGDLDWWGDHQLWWGYLQPSWKPCKSVPLSPSGIPPPQRIMFWNFEKILSVNIQARIVYLFLPRIPADPYFSLDLSDLFYTNTGPNKEIKRHLIPFLLKNGENQAEISKSHENECQKSVVNDKSFGRPLKIS